MAVVSVGRVTVEVAEKDDRREVMTVGRVLTGVITVAGGAAGVVAGVVVVSGKCLDLFIFTLAMSF